MDGPRGRVDEGFTLIEILVVLVVLTVLAAIVVLAVGRTSSDAVVSSCVHDVTTIQLAEEAFSTHHTVYASSADELLASNGGNLRTWPDSASLTFTIAGPDASHPGYALMVAGSAVNGGSIDAASGMAAVHDACAPAP